MRRTSVKFAAMLLTLHALSFGAPDALAQEGGCSLGVSGSPRLRGLRLGMTAAQLSERYPRLPALKADEFGQVKATFASLKEVDEAAFEGVESVNVNFVDDRLVAFSIFYKAAPFDSMDQFLAQLRESLKLPGPWAGEGYAPRRLSCDGFRMEAGPASYYVHWLSPYIKLWEPGAEDVVERRAAEKRERQRRAFKP